MSVTALTARTGRHSSHPAGPRRSPVSTRRAVTPAPPAVPALTLTLAIPLIDDHLSTHARRLLETVRELVELGHGTVTVTPPPEPATAAPGDAAQDAAETEPTLIWPRPAEPVQPPLAAPADPNEIRLLSASRQVLVGGTPLSMTRLEYDLLHFLAANPRRVFSRIQLLNAVWGYEHTGERTVDVHIRRLRVKLGTHLPLVTTVYGVGYRLSDDARVVIVEDQ